MNLQFTYQDFLSALTPEEIVHPMSNLVINAIAYDSRKLFNSNTTVFFALKGEQQNGISFLFDAYTKGVRLFVIERNENIDYLKDASYFIVKDTLKGLQSLAKFHRSRFKIPVVAITGSVGKTTVKEWTYHLLKERYKVARSPKSYNSQLGVAISLFEINATHEIALIEAGISQPNEMSVLFDMIQPTLGVFTSFGSAHAYSFKSVNEHFKEKTLLFNLVETTYISDSISNENFDKNKIKGIIVNTESTLAPFELDIPFKDKASKQNTALAIALARHFKVSDESIHRDIKDLPSLALRLETFDGINESIVINDTYNLDIDALIHSLEYQRSISTDKSKVAIIATTSLDQRYVNQIKEIIGSYQLDKVYYIDSSNAELPMIENAVILIKGSRKSNLEKIIRNFQLKKHKTRLEINLTSIKENLNLLRSYLHKTCNLLVMVKASSYGSGAVKIASFLEKNGVNYLGVAYADEGIELRKNGVNLPILVMNTEEDSFDDLITYQLEPTIYSFQVLDQFVRTLIHLNIESYPVHLKFDTGMKRLGFDIGECDQLSNYLLAQPEVYVKSIYSHLADADNLTDRSFSETQIQRFESIISHFNNVLPYHFLSHLTNTEGTIHFPKAHYDMVRVGIGIYGFSSDEQVRAQLIPTMNWKSIISQIKLVKKGESIGYGKSFIADKDTNIAIVPVGYADGLKRNLSNGVGKLYVQSKACPIVGNICMDMTMIDITGISVKEGAEVEIIGEHQSILDLANDAQTIPYEILTSIPLRVHRIYIEN